VTDNAGVERTKQVAQSDWTDQDLLTKDEARQRLVEEIARTRSRLEELAAGAGDPVHADAEVTLLARRLNAMESVRDEYDQYLGPT
jgi:hypothetical protein